MNAIKGKYRGGQVVLNQKTDWPDDADVLVELIDDKQQIGMREEDWPEGPEAIAEWMRWVDSLEPIMSPEDEAKWHAALEDQKNFEKANFAEHADKLKRMFD
jgi:hypothetical protein